MAKDSRVTSAISHWAPRFISNGVRLADFEDVTSSIERWEDWCRAWSERAAVHEELGRDCLQEGYKLTAGEHRVRAGIYYHFAKFLFVQDMEQMRTAHMKAVECFRDGVAFLRPFSGERVAIPFEGKTIIGVLRGSGPASGHVSFLKTYSTDAIGAGAEIRADLRHHRSSASSGSSG